MFDMTIIDSDAFLDLPFSAQALYFHLFARSDADGSVNNARSISRAVCATYDDLELLKLKAFIVANKKGLYKVSYKISGKEAATDEAERA